MQPESFELLNLTIFSFSLFTHQYFIQTDFGHFTNNESHILNET